MILVIELRAPAKNVIFYGVGYILQTGLISKHQYFRNLKISFEMES